MEQELSARQGKRQIAEFIEHNKVQPAELFSYSPLAACTCLGLKFVDQIDDVEEPAAFAVTDTGAGDRNALILETLLAFKRAGASGVLTYHAVDAARLIA